MTPAIPKRIAIVQCTLPPYRVPAFAAILAAAPPGSILLHGDVRSARHLKYNAVRGEVPFAREVLPVWTTWITVGGKIFNPQFMPGLYAALKRHRPEVIVTEGESNLLNNLAVLAYARRHGVPYVWWGLGRIPGSRPSGLRNLLGGVLRRMIGGSAGVACYSGYGRDFYLGEGAPADNCRVVPNALDQDAIERDIARFADQAATLRDEAGIGKDDIVLLTVGALEPTKRIEIALRALPLLGGLGRRVHYWVVGDGVARPALEDEARRLGGAAQVTFWGMRRDDVSRFFLAADLFVLPGLGGLALNHAMGHGLPAIAGPADGTERDLLGDGACGKLLDKVTPESLAAGVAELAAHGRLRELGAAARERIRAGYTLPHMVTALGDIVGTAAR